MGIIITIIILIISGVFIFDKLKKNPDQYFISSSVIMLLAVSLLEIVTAINPGALRPDLGVLYAIVPLLFFVIINVYHNNTREAPTSREEAPSKNAKLYIIIGFIALATLIVCFFFLSKQYIGNDEGSYIYEPGLILQGQMPFRDFISRAPTEIYLLALIFKFFGSGIGIIKIFNAMVVALISYLVYAIVRQHQRKSIAVIASLCTLLNATFILTSVVLDTTGVSILLVLLSCYFIKKESMWASVSAGLLLALAVFTREINAFFVLAILIFFVTIKNWKKLWVVSISGAVLAAIVIGYFSNAVGVYPAISMLLGIGHLGVTEAKASSDYSFTMLTFFLLSIAPVITCLFILKTDRSKYRLLYPELLWVASSALFYIFYAMRRGFILSYGAEFVPLVVIIVFSVCVFDSAWYDKKKLYAAVLPAVLAFSLWPYIYVSPITIAGKDFYLSNGVALHELIGSGLTSEEFNKINQVIKKVAQPGDVVLTGNLGFVTENNLQQFMEISRPLAYAASSTVYEAYNAPSPDEIAFRVSQNPPKVIIGEPHFYASLWNNLRQTISDQYYIYYFDDYCIVFLRKDIQLQK